MLKVPHLANLWYFGAAMNPPGHIAFSYLVARSRPTPVQGILLLGLFFGALFPDILDKSLMHLGVYPWGRTVGHSALVFSLVALVGVLVLRRHDSQILKGFILGWASHFAADLLDDIVAGMLYDRFVVGSWFTWPYLNPDMYQLQFSRSLFGPCHGCYTALEVAVIGVMVLVGVVKGRPVPT